MDPQTATWAVFAAYLAALFGLAWMSRRSGSSLEGFFLGNKGFPGWAIAFSTNATGESGWLLLGLTGMGYFIGLSALWIIVGEVLGIALAWMLLARRLKRGADHFEAITVPDYLAGRFADKSGMLRIAAVVIILSMVVIYTSAQVVATGKAFHTFLDLDYATGAIMGGAIALAYTTVGGFAAVVYTDVLQGVLMLIGLAVLPIVGISVAGGWDPMLATLRADDPHLVSLFGAGGLTTAGIVAIISSVAIGMPFLGVPQLLVRFMALKSEGEVRQAASISVACLAVYTVGAVLTGVAGRALFPGLADHETIMPTMSRELFSPVVTGLFVTVVLAAIMSTVDSLVILASSAVVRDIAQKVFGLTGSQRQLGLYSKLVTLAIGAIAVIVALDSDRAIFSFVLFAWSGLGAAFGPVVLCSLYWKRMTRAGALAGMVGGFATTIAWVLWGKEQNYGLYEAVPGYVAAFILIWVVSQMTEPPPDEALPETP
ncbi:MAG: sodium/proline symporter [Pseudohongiellaceae bacterium]|jgi:sodium/proline symporter